MIFLLVKIGLFLIRGIRWPAYAGIDCFEHPRTPTKKIPSSLSKTHKKYLQNFFTQKIRGWKISNPQKALNKLSATAQQLSGVSIYGW